MNACLCSGRRFFFFWTLFSCFAYTMSSSVQSLTVGCETVDMTLRRNGLGQLGFHVRLDGTVAEVTPELLLIPTSAGSYKMYAESLNQFWKKLRPLKMIKQS